MLSSIVPSPMEQYDRFSEYWEEVNSVWIEPLLVFVALLLDRMLGDPSWLPHPVVAIGRLISFAERHMNRVNTSVLTRRMCGVILALVVPAIAWLVSWGILRVAYSLAPVLGVCLAIWMIATAIAWKSLMQAGMRVYHCLQRGDLANARLFVGYIVGRDTKSLSEEEIVRATVETLAENIVDAIVAPVMFAILGGAPLIWWYKAVNTLDSMVGYKNERYHAFGWASARLDDVVNYLPARVTALLLWSLLIITRKQVVASVRIYRRDARKHPSPNSGVPESIVAGALGVRLGGWNSYHGIPSYRAEMGDALRPLAIADIRKTSALVEGVTWMLAGISLFLFLGAREVFLHVPAATFIHL